MAYIKPHQVVHPVSHLSKFTLIYDGGEYRATDDQWTGWAFGKGLWDGGLCYLFRWNSSYSGNPSGGPDYGWPRGYGGVPEWCVLPLPIGEAIRRTILAERPQAAHAAKIRDLNEKVVIETE